MSGAPPCESLVQPNVTVAFCFPLMMSTPVAPYVVGSNPNSPANPHSAMASGGDDITSRLQEAYTLYGGAIGGKTGITTSTATKRKYVQELA